MKSDVDNTQCDIQFMVQRILHVSTPLDIIGYYWILLLTIRMCAVQKDDQIVVGGLESSSTVAYSQT